MNNKFINHKILCSETKLHNKKDQSEIDRCALIIAGTRTFTSEIFLNVICKEIIDHQLNPSLIISGGAKGIDKLGEKWAELYNVSVGVFPARWGAYGKIAGHMRNNEMADQGDVLLLLWDGKSSGSKQMLAAALQRKLMVVEVVLTVEVVEYVETPDVRLATAIKTRMEKCGGYCPCDPTRDDDHKCPCLKMRNYGLCCCGLFVEKTWK